jgi:hypothetical protein
MRTLKSVKNGDDYGRLWRQCSYGEEATVRRREEYRGGKQPLGEMKGEGGGAACMIVGSSWVVKFWCRLQPLTHHNKCLLRVGGQRFEI